MSERREKIAATKAATLWRVDEWFLDEFVGKHYALEVWSASGPDETLYEGFLDAWGAYLSACGWKDPGA